MNVSGVRSNVAADLLREGAADKKREAEAEAGATSEAREARRPPPQGVERAASAAVPASANPQPTTQVKDVKAARYAELVVDAAKGDKAAIEELARRRAVDETGATVRVTRPDGVGTNIDVKA